MRYKDRHDPLEVVQGGEHFDLLFTDIVMPGGMNRKQLADALSIMRPGMKHFRVH